MSGIGTPAALDLSAKVETFVRAIIVPYEKDPRSDHHDCPTDELVAEMKEKARAAYSEIASLEICLKKRPVRRAQAR